MRRNVISVVLGLLSVMVFGLAGCGGGGDGGGGATVSTPSNSLTSGMIGNWNVTDNTLAVDVAGLTRMSIPDNSHIKFITDLSPSSYQSNDGTYAISGNTIIFNLTTSNTYFNNTLFSTNPISPPYSDAFTVTLSGSSMTWTLQSPHISGGTATFSKTS